MYFTEQPVKFFSSGSTLLDCVLSGDSEKGGWSRGRVVNLVGDKACGKSLLALEAIANNSGGDNRFTDVEEAFDLEYMQSLGMPIDSIKFENEVYTVEEFYSRLEQMESEVEDESNGIFVLDSLDALSDAAELERKIDDKSMAMNKAKKMSEMFRRINAKIAHKSITLMVISQIRDMIGTSVPAKTRAGGRALDFYASQILWLYKKKDIDRTIDGKERTIGIDVLAKCKKNKVAMPFRECGIKILFGYGVDNLWSNLEWLAEIKEVDKVNDIVGTKLGDSKASISGYAKKTLDLPKEQRQEIDKAVSKIVRDLWVDIEEKFRVKNTKY